MGAIAPCLRDSYENYSPFEHDTIDNFLRIYPKVSGKKNNGFTFYNSGTNRGLHAERPVRVFTDTHSISLAPSGIVDFNHIATQQQGLIGGVGSAAGERLIPANWGRRVHYLVIYSVSIDVLWNHATDFPVLRLVRINPDGSAQQVKTLTAYGQTPSGGFQTSRVTLSATRHAVARISPPGTPDAPQGHGWGASLHIGDYIGNPKVHSGYLTASYIAVESIDADDNVMY